MIVGETKRDRRSKSYRLRCRTSSSPGKHAKERHTRQQRSTGTFRGRHTVLLTTLLSMSRFPSSHFPAFFDFLQNWSHCRLTVPHHAVDEIKDGGGLPAWTEKEAALLPLVPPAVRCRRSGSLHPPARSVRNGPATRPRLVSSSPKTA